MGSLFIDLARRTKDVANTYGVLQETVYGVQLERDRPSATQSSPTPCRTAIAPQPPNLCH